MNKRKIINDPVYGFITVESDLIFDIIDHSSFQRLRRIKQLGLTDLVYPGALHTRFHHALGAMHLMGLALNNLRLKGHEISDKEYEAAQAAILLHDIGHGPFSHALEYSLLQNISHETLSQIIMGKLNKEFNGALDLALQMFNNTYKRKFFHQLISSQLDIDRLDYLKRDGFYTGVSEGTIGSDRIIKLLNIVNDEIVVEEKGIYSIEHFLIARRVMYWQVYLHKATVCAEKMLVQVIKRAKELSNDKISVAGTDDLKIFLEKNISIANMQGDQSYLDAFLSIDDYDIWTAIKSWRDNKDFILSYLSRCLLDRKLFKIIITDNEPDKEKIESLTFDISNKLKIKGPDLNYFIFKGVLSNEAYESGSEKINILMKTGEIKDLASASDLPNIKVMSKIVKKHYLCSPKNVYL